MAHEIRELDKVMLGSNTPWFPGNQAKDLDGIDWSDALSKSPHAEAIPGVLAEAHELLHGEQSKPLSAS